MNKNEIGVRSFIKQIELAKKKLEEISKASEQIISINREIRKNFPTGKKNVIPKLTLIKGGKQNDY